MEEYITISEYAKRVGRSRGGVYQMLKYGAFRKEDLKQVMKPEWRIKASAKIYTIQDKMNEKK